MTRVVIVFKQLRRDFSSSVHSIERCLELRVKDFKYQVLYHKYDNVNKYTRNKAIKPVILLPAAGEQLRHYQWFTQFLSQYTDVIVIGHCATPNIFKSNSMNVYKTNMKDFKVDIQVIKNTLDHFNISQANFVGISYGAISSYSFANRYPSMVNILHLSSIGSFVSDRCLNDIAKWKRYCVKNAKTGFDMKKFAQITAASFYDDKKKQRIAAKYFMSIFKSSPSAFYQLHYFFEQILDKKYAIGGSNEKFNNLPNIKTNLICASSDVLYSHKSVDYLRKIIGINCDISQIDGDHLWQNKSKQSQNTFCEHITNSLVQSTTDCADYTTNDTLAVIQNII